MILRSMSRIRMVMMMVMMIMMMITRTTTTTIQTTGRKISMMKMISNCYSDSNGNKNEFLINAFRGDDRQIRFSFIVDCFIILHKLTTLLSINLVILLNNTDYTDINLQMNNLMQPGSFYCRQVTIFKRDNWHSQLDKPVEFRGVCTFQNDRY